MARYRFRTWLRRHAPMSLVQHGFAAKGRQHCGRHEWYLAHRIGSISTWRCYHCEFGQKMTGGPDV